MFTFFITNIVWISVTYSQSVSLEFSLRGCNYRIQRPIHNASAALNTTKLVMLLVLTGMCFCGVIINALVIRGSLVRLRPQCFFRCKKDLNMPLFNINPKEKKQSILIISSPFKCIHGWLLKPKDILCFSLQWQSQYYAFFFQKTKQKNINLPADIDIFIYLIKIDCVGVKRVATGVLWTNTRINTEGSTKCCRTCCKVSKIRFPCLCQCGLMAHNDLQSEWVLVDLYLSGSEVQSENVFFIIIILSLGLGVGRAKSGQSYLFDAWAFLVCCML